MAGAWSSAAAPGLPRSTPMVSAPVLHRYMTAALSAIARRQDHPCLDRQYRLHPRRAAAYGSERGPPLLPRLQRQRDRDDDLSRLADRAQDRPRRELRLQLRHARFPRSPALFRQSVVSAGGRRLVSAARPARPGARLSELVLYAAASGHDEEEARWISRPIEARLRSDEPPAGFSMAAQALWWQAKGDWHQAHQCAQQQPDAEGRLGACLSAPRRGRSAQCRRLVRPRRPAGLDRAAEGGMGDDRPRPRSLDRPSEIHAQTAPCRPSS